MKTYKEYYQFGLKKFLEWEGRQKEEWWLAGAGVEKIRRCL